MVGEREIAAVSKRVVEEHNERDIVTVQESRKLTLRTKEEEEEGAQLLPGIPNDLTINEIAPKLPWEAFHALSLVSCGWKRAIQSRRVYNARVRKKSMQTLIAVNADEHFKKFHLYSVKDGSCYHLPPIPGLQQIPEGCKCISMDGKLYVLGGFKESTSHQASASVFLLDLVGHRQWRQCASMAVPRGGFGCGLLDGKIYVFGGSAKPISPFTRGEYLSESEVYDPKEDTWSPIMPMTCGHASQRVTKVGEEFFLYGGLFYAPKYLGMASTVEAYHPLKDRWRNMKRFLHYPNPFETISLVMVGGILHKVSLLGLYRYEGHANSPANSWTHLKSFSFPAGIESRDTHRVSISMAVFVDDVLLLDVVWRSWLRSDRGSKEDGHCQMISQGIGGENKEMVFQKAQCPSSQLMCLIEL